MNEMTARRAPDQIETYVDVLPHVAVAPGLLSETPVVVRDEDDTDVDYDAKVRLLNAALT